ncbi:PTS sugar transporter subunit IIB [Clostridium oceanicum]|uniref:PTS sugar transporter subunit IIB n=1 Tax=Clostridium oceanicum TaxID=1543 RepID=A0ABP3V135_9CLOT
MKILLACSSGMSTSLLVTKMEKYAEQEGIKATIWAVGQDKVEQEMENAEVILLGPQMRFLKSRFEPKAKELNIPIDVINPMIYGRCDGKAVLEMAIKLIDNNK